MRKNKRYVGIFGGALVNKGAQAMTCISVNEILEQYPGYTAVMFGIIPDDCTAKMRARYNFMIEKDIIFGASIKKMITSVFQKNPYHFEKHIEDILQNMEFAVDISGYCFGMNFKGDYFSSIHYLFRIYIMKKYKIRFYIMPQSFGPFLFKTRWDEMLLGALMRYMLRYPQRIYAREKQGLREMKKYTRNVQLSPDMVLSYGKEIQLERIYKSSYCAGYRRQCLNVSGGGYCHHSKCKAIL